MNKVISGAALLAALLTVAAVMPAEAAGPICLSTRNIRDTTPQQDGTAICPDLKFNGFAWTTSNPMESVCENEQTLQVFRSGEICALGKFTQVAPPHMEQHAQR
jgi:hypothetical protein